MVYPVKTEYTLSIFDKIFLRSESNLKKKLSGVSGEALGTKKKNNFPFFLSVSLA